MRAQHQDMTWRTPFTALLTVPASIAMGIGLAGLALVALEASYGVPDWLPPLSPETARTILSVVATAAMTALSLAYSLTLVVFTLAASSIGPRLLKRFTTERTNQVTAGLLGGTFLYSIAVLTLSTKESTVIATFGAGILATASVVGLIWFVRTVAQSVSIDDELAKIATRLNDGLAHLQRHSEGPDDERRDENFIPAAKVVEAGYLARFNRDALVAIAVEEDVFFRVERGEGEYLTSDTTVVTVSGSLSPEGEKRLRKTVRQEPARSDTGTVQFSVNLMVEIGLRALSPGVNDTFTALAVADMLSGALTQVARTKPRPEVLRGPDGAFRVVLPGTSFCELLDTAYHPLRRASTGNILMAQGIARAFERLHGKASCEAREALRHHASLLIADITRAGHSKADVESVCEMMPTLLTRNL